MEKKLEDNESAQLLQKPAHEDQPHFSVIRARIVSAFVPVFALSPAFALDSLMPQFLVQRMADDAGFTNSTQFSACVDEQNNSMVAIAADLQAQASKQLMYYNLVQTIPAFFACLLMGSYTDYIGRRFLLLLPVFTTFLKAAIICCAIKFQLDLRFLYLAYAIDGLVGSWFFMLVAHYSFTVDITFEKKDRTFWIYFVGCSSSITAAAISIGIGYLIRVYGFFEATLFLCSLILLSFIVPLIFLPETLQHRRSIKGVSPLTNTRKIVGFYLFDGTVRRRAAFCVCLLLFVTGIANDLNVSSLDARYQMTDPFCWDSVQIGDYSAIRSAGGHFFGVMLFKALQIRISIEHIGLIGALFQGGAFVLEAFIKVSWQFYLVPVLLIPNCPSISIIRSMFSMLADPDQQGAVFSSIAVVETLCNLVSTQIYNQIYSATVSYMPGAVYLVMASISCVTLIFFGVYSVVREKPQSVTVVVSGEVVKKESIQKSIQV